MNFTVYPGFFSDYFIRASKSYVESLKLFSLYFMLAPEACLDRAQGSSPARLRGVGEEGEALQAGPAPRSPSDAQAEHGPAVPHPVHPLVPGHWAPLPLDTEGSAQLSPLPQPTQSGDGGLALRPGHGSRRGWDKGSRVGVLCSHFCASRNGPEDGVLPPSLNPPNTHTSLGRRFLEDSGACRARSMLTPGTWALGQHCPHSDISGPVCAPGHSLRRPPASPAHDLPRFTYPSGEFPHICRSSSR